MRITKLAVLALALAVVAGCGGGDGNGATGSAVSGRVPYLLSAPTVTFAAHPSIAGHYDVTVTLEADGPTGVAFVGLWIKDQSNSSNFDHLDLVYIPGTKRWKAATYPLLPLPAGQYYIDSITLNDGDPLTADPLRTGWYVIMPPLSTSAYFVDERETSGIDILYYNWGLSAIPLSRFTLP